MTMKNNFKFLALWLPTFVIASFITALGSGVLQMAAKFILPDRHSLQCFIVWLILSIIICASLAKVSKKLGEELNRGSKEFSTGIPVFNMIICGVIYVILYAVMNGRALVFLQLFPSEMFMVNCFFGPEGAPLQKKIIFPIIQFMIYIVVSLLFYILAKRKQENSEGVKKLRGEKKKPNNRFGIDIDI